MEFLIKQELDMRQVQSIVEETDREYGDIFGRYYDGMIEQYMCEDADAVLVTLGSLTGTARIVVDSMRSEGYRVGLVKLRFMRPFPKEEIMEIGSRVKAMGVVDKDISVGYEGIVFTNVNSALSDLHKVPHKLNFIAGLGGRNVSKAHIRDMYMQLLEAAEGKEIEKIQFVNARCEYDG
jgi:pyruvate ferredoxin oxidoreductase alpha subunit